MKKISKTMEKAKYSCFGKVSVSKSSPEEKEVEALQKEKISLALSPSDAEKEEKEKDVDVKLAAALHNLNIRNFEKEIESLTSVKVAKGKSAAIFKLKERVLGPKETSLDAVTIEDPTTGVLVYDPKTIKKVTVEYCTKLLSNRMPSEGYEEVYEKKLKLHEERMKEIVENDQEELQFSQFTKALENVSKNTGININSC